MDFELKLKDISRRQNTELEQLQNSGTTKTASLEKKERELSAKQNRQIIERDNAREQVVRVLLKLSVPIADRNTAQTSIPNFFRRG